MTKSANDNMTSLHFIRNEASNWELGGNILVHTNCNYGHHNGVEDVSQGRGDAFG